MKYKVVVIPWKTYCTEAGVYYFETYKEAVKKFCELVIKFDILYSDIIENRYWKEAKTRKENYLYSVHIINKKHEDYLTYLTTKKTEI